MRPSVGRDGDGYTSPQGGLSRRRNPPTTGSLFLRSCPAFPSHLPSELAEAAPHPGPLPAKSGAREKGSIAAAAPAYRLVVLEVLPGISVSSTFGVCGGSPSPRPSPREERGEGEVGDCHPNLNSSRLKTPSAAAASAPAVAAASAAGARWRAQVPDELRSVAAMAPPAGSRQVH
jgi:hypothetical protein